jgi:hypothetical protein
MILAWLTNTLLRQSNQTSTFAIFLMHNIVPFYSKPSTSVITDWDAVINSEIFKSQQFPEFEPLNFVGVEVLTFASLCITDTHNKARAGGVDGANIKGLMDELRRGYRLEKCPPIVVKLVNGQYALWDGYNRYSAASNIGIPDFPFAVYEIKQEWVDRLEDAYTIVSLSANNHATAKAATVADFVTNGTNYVIRNGNNFTLDQIADWVNSCDHSFGKTTVESIAKQIYHNTTVAVNIIPYPHPKTAHSWVANNYDAKGPKNPVLMCCKQDDYIQRAYMQIVENYVGDEENFIPALDNTEVVLYTKGCETAEEVLAQREQAIQKLAEFDAMVLKYAAKRMMSGKSSYEIVGALPQLVGHEEQDQLASIDTDTAIAG